MQQPWVPGWIHVDSCQFYLVPCCDPPSQKRCATSLGQSLCWLQRAVQTPGRCNRHAVMPCDRKFELLIQSPLFLGVMCVCVSWHLKLQDVVVLQRTIRLHELLQVVFSIRTPFWILVDIGATGFDVFFDVFCIFCPHTSESSATMCHPNQSQTHQSLSSMLMRPSAFASAFAKAVAI